MYIINHTASKQANTAIIGINSKYKLTQNGILWC